MPRAKRTFASPTSYVGATRRIWATTRSWRASPTWWRRIVPYGASLLLTAVAVILVTLYYLVLLVALGLWFPILIPFRLIRRVDRKEESRRMEDFEESDRLAELRRGRTIESDGTPDT